MYNKKNERTMKKEKVKKVKVDIYKVTIVYADCFEESFYRSFRDEAQAYNFCRRIYVEKNDCMVIDCFFEFMKKVEF